MTRRKLVDQTLVVLVGMMCCMAAYGIGWSANEKSYKEGLDAGEPLVASKPIDSSRETMSENSWDAVSSLSPFAESPLLLPGGDWAEDLIDESWTIGPGADLLLDVSALDALGRPMEGRFTDGSRMSFDWGAKSAVRVTRRGNVVNHNRLEMDRNRSPRRNVEIARFQSAGKERVIYGNPYLVTYASDGSFDYVFPRAGGKAAFGSDGSLLHLYVEGKSVKEALRKAQSRRDESSIGTADELISTLETAIEETQYFSRDRRSIAQIRETLADARETLRTVKGTNGEPAS